MSLTERRTMWTFILITVIFLGIKIACRILGAILLIIAALTDNLYELEESALNIICGIIKLLVAIPMFIWGVILLF